MLARMYAKKKRPLAIAGYPDDQQPEHPNGMTSPQGGQRLTHHGAATLSRSQSSRMSRHIKDERKPGSDAKPATNKGLNKFIISPSKEFSKDSLPKHAGGANEYGDGDYDHDCDADGSDDEPQLLRPRRRFVRSGLTTYEQWISKNAMGRRFKTPGTPSPDSPNQPQANTTITSPIQQPQLQRNGSAGANGGNLGNMSSLSNALQDVMHTRPTIMRSVIDPTAGPQKVTKSYVVEKNSNGDYFVASRRVPDGPVRVRMTKDDSFISSEDVHTAEAGATSHSEFDEHQAAANLMRRSEMDASYRHQWVGPPHPSASSNKQPTPQPTTVASVMASGKASIRRRLSNADRRSSLDRRSSIERSNHGSAATATASTDIVTRRPSSSVKVREPSRTGQSLINQMAHKYVDHMRARSSSRGGDTQPPALPRSRSKEEQPPPLPPPRREKTAPPPAPAPAAAPSAPLRAQSIQVIDSSSSGILNDHVPTTDKGPMTMDEFFGTTEPPPPPLPVKPSRSVFTKGKSSSRNKNKAASPAANKLSIDKEEEEVDNVLMNSFRNLKDVDALKRSRSLEEDENTKPVPASVIEISESEEEYPDYPDERATMDYGSSGNEDESAPRNSNITDFLGGFKSRNSINRNSLAGRHSLGLNSHRKDDFVSRAARSLRNSRKAAQETVKVESELSRKLREARGRVPPDLRGDPPHKRRGFLSRDGKRVRFDMTRYCREFEVIEPEESDDDNEVQRWQQRDSEQDDDDDDDEDDDELSNPSDYEDDIGVPIPGPVIAAAVAEGTPYFTSSPYVAPTSLRYSVNARPSLGRKEDERVSVVSRKSHGKKFEVLL